MKANSSRKVVAILSLTALTITMVIAPIAAKASPEKTDPKDLLKHGDQKITPDITPARPSVIPELKYEDTKLLGYYFGWPERLITERFNEALPAALKGSMADKQGAALSKIFAELYATQSHDDVKSLVARAELLKAEREKNDKDTQLNSASNHMIERMVDAGKWLLNDNSGKNTPERKEFLTQFESDWNERIKKNEEVIAYRDKAIDPQNTDAGRLEAKKWLRENVNRDQVMAFIDRQLKNGKDGEAAKWFKAMAWKDGDQYVADFKNNGKDVRFYAGKSDQEIAKNLAGYEGKSPDNAGLFGINFNKEQHTAEAKEFFGRDGKIEEGRPDGVKLPSWLKPDPSKALASTDPKAGLAEVAGKPVLTSHTPGNSGAVAGDAGKAAYDKYCLSCHTESKTKSRAGEAASAVGKRRSMPPEDKPQPSEAERTAIAAYVKSL
jgi:hypothetical protein